MPPLTHRPAASPVLRPPHGPAPAPAQRARSGPNGPRADPPPSCLTGRERDVVEALCEGLDRAEIARRIRRSRSTCDKAISAIYRSTGFGTAHQVVAWAHRIGLFESGLDRWAEPRR